MKDTDNMKEITNKNVDSNKQIRESTEKDVRRKEKIIRFGGGILVYIRDDIGSRIIECENLSSSFELSFNLKNGY